MKIRPGDNYSDQQVYIGWTTNYATPMKSGVPFYQHESGILVVRSPTDTNYQIFCKDETEQKITYYDTGIVFNSTPRTIEIIADSVGDKFWIRLDTYKLKSYAEHIPKPGTQLAFHLQTFTTVKDIKQIDLFGAQLTQSI